MLLLVVCAIRCFFWRGGGGLEWGNDGVKGMVGWVGIAGWVSQSDFFVDSLPYELCVLAHLLFGGFQLFILTNSYLHPWNILFELLIAWCIPDTVCYIFIHYFMVTYILHTYHFADVYVNLWLFLAFFPLSLCIVYYYWMESNSNSETDKTLVPITLNTLVKTWI